VRGASSVQRWVAGIPVPGWTRRPNAKDGLRLRARELRESGLTYPAIAAQLGVSKSSVSLWVRDLPAPERVRRFSHRARQMGRAYWEVENVRRDAARERTKAEAAQQVGLLSVREVLLVGAALYWAEGCKDRPYDRRETLTFINSDVRVIQTYLVWLDAMGVSADRRSFRLSIHETADVTAAP
jgi:predicted transcriptional regulator